MRKPILRTHCEGVPILLKWAIEMNEIGAFNFGNVIDIGVFESQRDDEIARYCRDRGNVSRSPVPTQRRDTFESFVR